MLKGISEWSVASAQVTGYEKWPSVLRERLNCGVCRLLHAEIFVAITHGILCHPGDSAMADRENKQCYCHQLPWWCFQPCTVWRFHCNARPSDFLVYVRVFPFFSLMQRQSWDFESQKLRNQKMKFEIIFQSQSQDIFGIWLVIFLDCWETLLE